MEHAAKKDPVTLTDLLRTKFKGVLELVAGFLNRIGLQPNTVTLLGLLGIVVGSIFLAYGRFITGGLIILLTAPFDALDGTMARLRGESSQFGAFVDSVTDRYAEMFIFGGLLIHFLLQESWLAATLTYFAAAGSLMVSYVRARAQAVGFEAKVGLLTRVERFLVLIPCLIINQPMIAVSVIALFTNITALQRILNVRSQAHGNAGGNHKS